jgi:SAM-dependent methyltransferase
MRVGNIPESWIDYFGLATRRAPIPLLDTMIALMRARTIMAAVKLGIFDALTPGPLPVNDIALKCGTNPAATEKLLAALHGARYLERDGHHYRLAPVANQWLCKHSIRPLRDAVLHRFLDLRFLDFERFVQTGACGSFHQSLTAEDWGTYQRGQHSQALLMVEEVVRRTPIRRGARQMLDIGGGHGLYSEAFCSAVPSLSATILDLPGAIDFRSNTSHFKIEKDRLTFISGDALSADLQHTRYDVALIANLVHHLDEQSNRKLMLRVAEVLRVDGIAVVLDLVRPRTGRRDQISSLFDLYFAATSNGGLYTVDDIADWQRVAGLEPLPARHLRTMPNCALQIARKERTRARCPAPSFQAL